MLTKSGVPPDAGAQAPARNEEAKPYGTAEAVPSRTLRVSSILPTSKCRQIAGRYTCRVQDSGENCRASSRTRRRSNLPVPK